MVTEEKPIVRVTADSMEAYIMLKTPMDGGEYTYDVVMTALNERGVIYGINQSELKKLVAEKRYGLEVRIAKGREPEDGVDGYYEYHFNCNFDKKPLIRPDGSVDYRSVKSIEAVAKGQVIAEYHPCIIGTDGENVLGKPVIGKHGREQLPLKGKGFERQDANTYISLMDGKIDTQNDKIIISPVHELRGNAELSGGDIDFHGDVVIHGSVESGMRIRATGTITVDGVVESCTLEAGKDIILRSGMLGGNKASVKTKGSITAKFFEYTTIECEGDIQADVLLDCQVECLGKITMNGSHGSIIGGNVHGVKGIEVSTLGNIAEKKTHVFVGASPEAHTQLLVLEKQIGELSQGLAQIEAGLQKFEELEAARGVSYKNDPRRVSLLRVKIRDSASLANIREEAQRVETLIASGKGACITVIRDIFPGVILEIEDAKLILPNPAKSVEFYKLKDKIVTRPCI